MANKFSNLASRVAVALVAIPFIIFASYSGGMLFALFVLTAATFALTEFYSMAKAKGAKPQMVTGILGLIAVQLSFFPRILPAEVSAAMVRWNANEFSAILFLFMTAVMLVELFRNNGSAFLNAGFTIFGVMYIGLFLAAFTG
ncbi:MAG: phosphatidate cytidylyltransferase, partial [Bacteroidetes bacterium]|nr:phosphatidate cytidylyltransferase [Bacteroidota bacterium]